jgi:hypothetical protein
MIDFPNNPTVGQTFTAAGVTWTWDGTKWTSNGLNVPYLPLAGGTMSGPITLQSDPAAPLQPATKQYVDFIEASYSLGSNRIINGDMRICQRAGSGNAAGYMVDRWRIAMSQPGKLSWNTAPSAAMAPNGFPTVITLNSLSAYSPAATDSFCFFQPIEADMISDFAFGTANAQPITLSFWVMASVAGTYSGALGNSPNNRCYPFTFTLAAATTWQKFVITVPGDTSGTWTMSGNGGGMFVTFDLGSGPSLRAPAGSWQSVSVNGATGAAGVVTTNGALMQFTGVKLEVGSIATPYNRQSLAKSLADCQRYYSVGSLVVGGYTTAGGSIITTGFYPVAMRAAPTITPSYVSMINVTAGNLTVNNVSPTSFYNTGGGSAVGYTQWQNNWTANAEL